MENLLLKIKYNMTLDEISDGFKLFWKKYQLKKAIIYTVVYSIALVLGVDFVVKNHENFYGYLLIGIALGLIVFNWYKPVMIRKKMLNTISALAEEQYITEIYPDKVQITTEILPDENSEENNENSDGEENSDEEKQENVVTTYYFGSDFLDAMENDKMFLLFVNRSLIYIYPKRCLSDSEQDTLREILTSKSIL